MLPFSDLKDKKHSLEEDNSRLGKELLEATKSGNNTLQDIMKCKYVFISSCKPKVNKLIEGECLSITRNKIYGMEGLKTCMTERNARLKTNFMKNLKL